jgi:hypothetical protein
MIRTLAFLVLCLFVASPLVADRHATERKPLSDILATLERSDIGVITEVELDDGVWKLDAGKDDSWERIHVDPVTGEIVRRRPTEPADELPPDGALPLSRIVQGLEAADLGHVVEIELDDGWWEVELRREGRRVKIDVHPVTGQRRGDRR